MVAIEHYGNIVTTIAKPQHDLLGKPKSTEVDWAQSQQRLGGQSKTPAQQRRIKKSYKVECGSYKNNLSYHETFEEAKEGELFVIAGSKNTLELAVRNGSAAAIVKAKVGNRVKIS